MEEVRNPTVPVYGMALEEGPERIALEMIIGEAYMEAYWSRTAADFKVADAIAERLAETPGISIVTHGSYAADYSNRCAHYAFGTVLGCAWAMPHQDIGSEIWREPLDFLTNSGFELVETPVAGDVIAYARYEDTMMDGFRFEHFGIVQADGTIVSKIGMGPVVNHALNALPISFGSYAYFLRKNTAATEA